MTALNWMAISSAWHKWWRVTGACIAIDDFGAGYSQLDCVLAEVWDERRLTLSNTYRDATSNQYCLTAGQFFDKGERLLPIDIDAVGL